jgi:hypothetical protein
VEPPIIISDKPPRPDATPVPTPIEDTIPTEVDPSNLVRTPGSDIVLPANPLMNLTDESLTGFVDCTLYEETGNFFAEPGTDVGIDDVIEPPMPRTRTSPAISELAEPLDLEPPGGRVVIEPAVEVAPEIPVEEPVLPRTVTPPSLPRTATGDIPPPRPHEAAIRTEHIAVPTRGPNPWLVIATLMLAIGAGVVVFIMLTNRDPEPKPVAAKPPVVAPADAAIAVAPPDAAVIVATPTDAAVVVTAPADAAVAMVADAATATPPEPRVMDHRDPAAEPGPDEPPAGPIDTPAVGAGPCKLTVHSTPAGSMITINGQSAGPSPITVSGPCTARTVEISHPRYQTITRVVTPAADKPAVIDETLVRPTHTVMVVTTPPGADISIDGRHAGTTPTAIKVLGFTSVELSFKKFGFLPQTKRLYSKVANDQVAVKLTPW